MKFAETWKVHVGSWEDYRRQPNGPIATNFSLAPDVSF
jgi:hypothetical protein